jgi:hypothetical protein
MSRLWQQLRAIFRLEPTIAHSKPPWDQQHYTITSAERGLMASSISTVVQKEGQ